MGKPIDEDCARCTAWVSAGADQGKGLCQAHPPAPLFGANINQPGSGIPELQFYFPVTNEFDWCREFVAVAPPAPDSPA